MNKKLILLTVIISCFTSVSCTRHDSNYAKDIMLKKKPSLKAVEKPAIEESKDIRYSAENLVKQIAYARLALGLKDKDQAFKHIDNALQLNTALKDAKAKYLFKQNVISGEFIYDYDTDFVEHYIPLENDLSKWSIGDNGPLWARIKTPEIKRITIVYLSPNVDTDIVESKLISARETVFKNEIDDAQEKLASLANDIIQMGERVDSPMTRARYSVALAHDFLQYDNFNSARISLKNARDALSLELNYKKYEKHHQEISAIIAEMKSANKMFINPDKNISSKIDSMLEKWWTTLKKFG